MIISLKEQVVELVFITHIFVLFSVDRSANAKQVSLKKFPKFLAEAISDGSPENLSDFIIKAAYERAEKEGLI